MNHIFKTRVLAACFGLGQAVSPGTVSEEIVIIEKVVEEARQLVKYTLVDLQKTFDAQSEQGSIDIKKELVKRAQVALGLAQEANEALQKKIAVEATLKEATSALNGALAILKDSACEDYENGLFETREAVVKEMKDLVDDVERAWISLCLNASDLIARAESAVASVRDKVNVHENKISAEPSGHEGE